MGIFDLFHDSLDPAGFTDLVSNHMDALSNWLNGGYRPRGILPQSERLIFQEYDSRWNTIYENTGRGLSIEDLSYRHKLYISSHKSEILRLYSIYSQYMTPLIRKVIALSTDYRYGFNAIAIKYANVSVRELELQCSNTVLFSESETPFERITRRSHRRQVASIYKLTDSELRTISQHELEMREAHEYWKPKELAYIGAISSRRDDINDFLPPEGFYSGSTATPSNVNKERQKINAQTSSYNQEEQIKKLQNYYEDQIEQTLRNRDISKQMLAIGLPNKTAIGNRMIYQFVSSYNDDEIEPRFSLHYYPQYLEATNRTNSELKEITYKILQKYFFGMS